MLNHQCEEHLLCVSNFFWQLSAAWDLICSALWIVSIAGNKNSCRLSNWNIFFEVFVKQTCFEPICFLTQPFFEKVLPETLCTICRSSPQFNTSDQKVNQKLILVTIFTTSFESTFSVWNGCKNPLTWSRGRIKINDTWFNNEDGWGWVPPPSQDRVRITSIRWMCVYSVVSQ